MCARAQVNTFTHTMNELQILTATSNEDDTNLEFCKLVYYHFTSCYGIFPYAMTSEFYFDITFYSDVNNEDEYDNDGNNHNYNENYTKKLLNTLLTIKKGLEQRNK